MLARRSLWLVLALPVLQAQEKIPCPNGEVRLRIDVRKLAIEYRGSALTATLAGLKGLGPRVAVEPKVLQTADAATQQWSEFLVGLAEGYNSCVLSADAYREGLNRIYPRLKEDATDLESIRKAIAEGRKADEQRLRRLLDSYLQNLRRMAEISNRTIVFERIEAVVAMHAEEIKTHVTQTVREAVEEIKRQLKNAPQPAEVKNSISEIRAALLANVDEAERAYNDGYDLLNRFRFRDAAARFRRAIEIIRLPEFYLSLSIALQRIPDLAAAETAAREGLAHIPGEKDKRLVDLNGQLAAVLLDRGNLPAAQIGARASLAAAEKTYGPEHAAVAESANLLATVLFQQGDFAEALRDAKRAAAVAEKAFPPDDPAPARIMNTLLQILMMQGDAMGALRQVGRVMETTGKALGFKAPETPALRGDLSQAADSLIRPMQEWLDKIREHLERQIRDIETSRGPDDPEIANLAIRVGNLLVLKGDTAGALEQANRARANAVANFGPGDITVAATEDLMGEALYGRGDLDGALAHATAAVNLYEKTLGAEHPSVAEGSDHIGSILFLKRDFPAALQQANKALAISRKIYGPDHARTATHRLYVGQILTAQGNFEQALSEVKQVLVVYQNTFGIDHYMVAGVCDRLGEILYHLGQFPAALEHTQRALKIYERVLGADTPEPEITLANMNVGQILIAQGNLNGALQFTQKALALGAKAFAPEDPSLAPAYLNMAWLQHSLGFSTAALPYAQKGLAMAEKYYGPNNPFVANFHGLVAQICEKERDFKCALDHTASAVKILTEALGRDAEPTRNAAAELRRLRRLAK